jgi:hypothetical protein
MHSVEFFLHDIFDLVAEVLTHWFMYTNETLYIQRGEENVYKIHFIRIYIRYFPPQIV